MRTGASLVFPSSTRAGGATGVSLVELCRTGSSGSPWSFCRVSFLPAEDEAFLAPADIDFLLAEDDALLDPADKVFLPAEYKAFLDPVTEYS